MRKLLIYILIISSFILINKKGRSQTLTIKNVSVINEQGHVRLSWEYNGGENLVVYRDSLEISNLSPIITLGSMVKSYIDLTANAHKKPRSYKIQSEITTSVSSEIISTYYLTYSYDSCLQQINLKWNDLETTAFTANDWTPTQFIVKKTEGGITQNTSVSASENEYTVENILENTNYTFSIETQWLGEDSTSFSNPVSKFTEMPQSPDYINALSVISDGENSNLQFKVASNSELNSYRLLKSDSYNGTFYSLETFISNYSIITATDHNSEPDNKITYYKLASVNECGNETTNSDVINNIVLNLENTDFVNTLSWNLLKDYDLLSATYEVYRISGNSEPELIRSISNYYSITDDTELLQGQNLAGQFCYYVKVICDSEMEEYYSQSNTECVYIKPKIYIPEAFTPNDDGINDLFLPVFSFLPKKYELRIYNRWGNIVFETSDPSKGWNGKESNGKPAPVGSYIYLLKIKTGDNQSVENRGSVTVIYPQQ